MKNIKKEYLIIGILSIIIVALTIFIVVNNSNKVSSPKKVDDVLINDNNNEKNPSDNNEENPSNNDNFEETKKKEDNTNLSLEEKLLKSTKAYIHCTPMLDLYKEENITNTAILVIALKNYIETNNINIYDFSDEEGTFILNIDKKTLEIYIKKMFGEVVFTHKSFDYDIYTSVTYNNNKEDYKLVSGISGCEGPDDTVFTKFSKSIIDNNNLYIEEYFFYAKGVEVEENDTYNTFYDLYSDYNQTKLYKRVNLDYELTSSDYEKAGIYKYTFTKDNENYIFKSIEKIK